MFEQHVIEYYYYNEESEDYEETTYEWLLAQAQGYGSAEHQMFGDSYLYNDCQGAW